MLAKRIIACLDVNNGKVVKGVQFRQHEMIGDILPLAEKYAAEGADELVFYDISASVDNRLVDKAWVKRIADRIHIPFTVAGGIQSVEQAREILAMGATKISINSPALRRPELINELVAALGSAAVVVGIDSHYNIKLKRYEVYQFTGDEHRTEKTAWQTLDWVAEVVRRGAGEIVLNCMNQDGVRNGYDMDQLRAVRAVCAVPLIASGGAGRMEHVRDVFEETKVDGALLASALHKNMIQLPKLRQFLSLTNATEAPNLNHLAWDKMDGLIPCVVQNADSGQVLMQGYMNRAAAEQSLSSGKVTFFSRSKQRLWMKGETSGNTLTLVELVADCDQDALLALAIPQGPTCHLGSESCWQQHTRLAHSDIEELSRLEETITARKAAGDNGKSYTAKLFADGIRRCAQKVGEEGVEVALAAVAQNDAALLNESADLLYHLFVVLHARDLCLADVSKILKQRRIESSSE